MDNIKERKEELDRYERVALNRDAIDEAFADNEVNHFESEVFEQYMNEVKLGRAELRPKIDQKGKEIGLEVVRKKEDGSEEILCFIDQVAMNKLSEDYSLDAVLNRPANKRD